jgi:hypothetical protein
MEPGASTHKEMTSMYNMLARGGDAWQQRKWRWLGTFNEACTRRATDEASYLDLVKYVQGGRCHQKGDRDTPAARPAFDDDGCLKLSSHRAIVSANCRVEHLPFVLRLQVAPHHFLDTSSWDIKEGLDVVESHDAWSRDGMHT